MHLASNSAFINVARILWGFNVGKALDANGKEIPVDIMAFSNGCARSSVFRPVSGRSLSLLSLTIFPNYHQKVQLASGSVRIVDQAQVSGSCGGHCEGVGVGAGRVEAVLVEHVFPSVRSPLS